MNRFRTNASPIGVLIPALAVACAVCAQTPKEHTGAAKSYARDVLPLLKTHCLDCHDTETAKGGLDLERFRDESAVMADRNIWAGVYEKVESGQMPPPRKSKQLTDLERANLLAWIAEVAARPDPALGAPDPGKPVLRRLTRLEYNNTIRDLLGLDTDLFMFPERLPFAGKDYFQPVAGKIADTIKVPLRQYGAKYPVLLGQSGLPGDNRAEHGYRNRGDAMNVSPLLLEKYVAVAGEIVNHPELPRRSGSFAELLGIDPKTLPAAAKRPGNAGQPRGAVAAVAKLVPAGNVPATAQGSALDREAFARAVALAFEEGRGGVFDVPQALANQTVAGKGGLIKVTFGPDGGKTLAINPNIDLWLVSFGTASASSPPALIANKAKGEKVYELTFELRDGDPDERIVQLGLCVLGRKGQSGTVTLTAYLGDDTPLALAADLKEGAEGNTFFAFAARPGESIRRLKVDASNVKGDYVLIDDIVFITDGRPKTDGSTTKDTKSTKDEHGEIGENKPPATALSATEASPLRDLRVLRGSLSPSGRVASDPRERLAGFMAKAFRRPVEASEIDRYFALFTAAKSKGKSEADAMRVALQAVLSSPSFLYIAEPVRAGAPKVRALDDHELGGRLSYFLWASAPDDELGRLADNGKLHDPATLEAQARRMLKSPAARELSGSFAAQWLRLDQLYTAKPDRQLFKSFYSGPQGLDTLHGAMLIEAMLLFETVMVEDRSILDFVDADYTWLNTRLAKHYGVAIAGEEQEPGPIVAGQPNRELPKDPKSQANAWHRVKLVDKTRGGFLSMAGPLTVTSLPFRTSPVKRGAWLLETVFNRPPTEPKVAFVLKDDTKEAAAATSVRQKFEHHRSNPNCYTCHVRLDPPGFALETFDPVGAIRRNDGPLPVDARGEWNGRSFDGPAGFKAALMANPDEFVRGFIEHLLSYALGRKLELFDMPAVTQIHQAMKADGYRFSRVVVEIARSYPFTHVRNVSPSQEKTSP